MARKAFDFRRQMIADSRYLNQDRKFTVRVKIISGKRRWNKDFSVFATNPKDAGKMAEQQARELHQTSNARYLYVFDCSDGLVHY